MTVGWVAVAVAGAAVGGGLAGAAVRTVLARMRRGAAVAPGWCEAGVGLLWAVPVLGVVAGALEVGWLPAALGLGVLTVAATATDLSRRRLPDRITGPAAVLAPLAVLPLGPSTAGAAVVGGVVLLAAHAAVHLAAPHALGAGDVKLAASLGALLAAAAWWALPAMPVVAAVLTLAGAAAGGRPASRSVPFGPPMLAATWGVLAVAVLAR